MVLPSNVLYSCKKKKKMVAFSGAVRNKKQYKWDYNARKYNALNYFSYNCHENNDLSTIK